MPDGAYFKSPGKHSSVILIREGHNAGDMLSSDLTDKGFSDALFDGIVSHAALRTWPSQLR
jgi:hypothetical protein